MAKARRGGRCWKERTAEQATQSQPCPGTASLAIVDTEATEGEQDGPIEPEATGANPMEEVEPC